MINPIFLITLGLFVLCAYMARRAALSNQRANASLGWAKTEGVLTDVQLWGTRQSDGERINADYLSVRYEYQIRGVQYSGSEVAFYQLHYPETIEFAQANPQDSRVEVFYNPKNIAESVLISGPHPAKPYSGLVLAGLGLFVSFAVFVAAWMGG